MPFNYELARRAVMSNGATKLQLQKSMCYSRNVKALNLTTNFPKKPKGLLKKSKKNQSSRNANWARDPTLGKLWTEGLVEKLI